MNEMHETREAIRDACIRACLEGYEDATLRGLCGEGAIEVAVAAIRRVDLTSLGEASSQNREPTKTTNAESSLSAETARMAGRFASPSPPSAGSGAAACGAISAGLLEWVATSSSTRGPQDFRVRARVIAGRAVQLRTELSAATQRDAEAAAVLLCARAGWTSDVRRTAIESLLGIGYRCSQVATLAAEVAINGSPLPRTDSVSTVRIAYSASSSALQLAEDTMRDSEDEGLLRDARKGIWRTRLLLQRVLPLLRDTQGTMG